MNTNSEAVHATFCPTAPYPPYRQCLPALIHIHGHHRVTQPEVPAVRDLSGRKGGMSDLG